MAGEMRAEAALDALGDPARREILRLLSETEMPVGRLAERLPISRPAVSRHLRLLREAGLVTDHHEGRRHVYRLSDEGLLAVQRYLEDIWGGALTRFRLVAENTTSREDRR